jgi:alpha-glucosidase
MHGHLWWQRGVIYQIYPRSFLDSNGDGIGDLPGIAARLDHLVDLGVDAVWISPFFRSPMVDFGYDISDYCDVDPVFGTLADFDALLAAAHAKGLRVILDYVPNHTSDRHPWFLESRASRTSPKRGWYVWRDPGPAGGPPNNWVSNFGGPAWTLDPTTGQYYYHAFLAEQPDLDWRNPEVRAAMLDVMRFWLDKGVDGFRVDAISHLVEDAALRDNPPNPEWKPETGPYRRLVPLYTTEQPELLECLSLMRRVLDLYGERMMITEAYLTIERLVMHYGGAGSGAHLPFNFQLIRLPWEARRIAQAIDAYEASLPPTAWPNWVLGNHDRSRIASRVGPAEARVAAMLLLTLRGTPVVYQGDEIGLADVPIPPDLVQDPWERNVPGLGLGRDGARTPMQWDASPHAGFTTGTPWLPVAADYRRMNVSAERDDPRSTLSLYRRLLALRRAEPALSVGRYRSLPAEGTVLAYEREQAGRVMTVALNLGRAPARFSRPGLAGRVALSTHLDREGDRVRDAVSLRADEGVLVAPG